MAVSVIVHPSLLGRIVLVAVFTPLGTVLCLLPFPRYARPILAIAAASVGAFGMTMSIALFSHNPSWSNIWDRLWVHDGLDWGSSKEKGLSAAFCFFLVTGVLSDWFLYRKIGENPDEVSAESFTDELHFIDSLCSQKWDRYLADYAAELPNDDRRAGTFAPLVSFWDKALGKHSAFSPVVPDPTLVSDRDIKHSLHFSPGKLIKQPVADYSLADAPDTKARLALLRKKGSRHDSRSTRARRTIKFSPQDDDSSDSGEGSTHEKADLWPLASRTNSSATLIDGQRSDGSSLLQPPARRWLTKPGEIPDYSDGEEDIANAIRREKGDRGSVWPPEFIRRHSTRVTTSTSINTTPSVRLTESPEPQGGSRHRSDRPHSRPVSSSPSSLLAADVTSVPATPSLIKAVERITIAHEALHRSHSATVTPIPPSEQERKASWDAFWSDVKTRARY